MTTRYQKRHYEDVARIIVGHNGGLLDTYSPANHKCLADDFADLFAADNPKCCIHCGYVKGTTEICDSANGQLRDEHTFEYGFDRDQFLVACGLKPETEQGYADYVEAKIAGELD